MADLSRPTGCAAVEPSLRNNSGSYTAGTEFDNNPALIRRKSRRLAGDPEFPERHHVSVVVDKHRHIKAWAEEIAKTESFPAARGRRVYQQAGVFVYCSRH
jgi:hypothetical protein